MSNVLKINLGSDLSGIAEARPLQFDRQFEELNSLLLFGRNASDIPDESALPKSKGCGNVSVSDVLYVPRELRVEEVHYTSLIFASFTLLYRYAM